MAVKWCYLMAEERLEELCFQRVLHEAVLRMSDLLPRLAETVSLVMILMGFERVRETSSGEDILLWK